MVTVNIPKKVNNGDYLDETYYNDSSFVVIKEAGETISTNDVVYFHLTDGKVYVSDTGTTDDIRANGLALTSANDGGDVVVQTKGVFNTTGLTDKEDYYLSTAGSISTTIGAVRIGTALSTTKLYINIIQDDNDPVQTIKFWEKSITGGITQLNAFWKECDGSTITDAESPLNGETLPNLNNESASGVKGRFIRGNSTSGLAETTSNLSHQHDYRVSNGAAGGVYYGQTANMNNTTKTTSDGKTGEGNENRPYSYTVVMLMKIK